MLELAKAISLLICILSLYWAAISAFFVPGSQWDERPWVALFKLRAAAAICFYSGMVFSWPSKTNPNAFQRLTATMPVRSFFWALGGIALLFLLSWYIAEGETQALSERGFASIVSPEAPAAPQSTWRAGLLRASPAAFLAAELYLSLF